MTTRRILLAQLAIAFLPLAALLANLNALPELVPIHYNWKNEVDDWGSRSELVMVVALLAVVAFGMSLLMRNLHRIDPKKSEGTNTRLMNKLGWVLLGFVTLIGGYIVFDSFRFSAHGETLSGKFVLAMVALMFAVIGNFMNSVKPNYFVGFRTPWTLENEDNWRATHQLGAKVWFYGGLILFLLILFMPDLIAFTVFSAGMVPMVLIPLVFSYRFYRRSKKA